MSDPEPIGPLPEGRWLWRRIYVFGTSAVAWGLLHRLLERTPPEAVVHTAQGLMSLMALTMILYLVAPTAQQLVCAVAAVFHNRRL